jgi:hypothetical protein
MGGAFVLIYLYIYTIFFTHHISLVTYHFKTEDQGMDGSWAIRALGDLGGRLKPPIE